MNDFLWGGATASYQCEGGWQEGGRVESMWDVYLHENHLENGDVASDHYHRFREDIRMMKEGGQNSYRFSLAWPRIIKNREGEVNQEGVDFYNRLIDACLEYGITPMVTIFHWDLPQYLEEKGGWLNRDTCVAYTHYAKVCFERFGDRVKLWATFNEPRYYTNSGYLIGNYPPGHQDIQETVTASYYMMLASAMAVEAFRTGGYDGQIGIVHSFSPVYTTDTSVESAIARRFADNFYNNWILDTAAIGEIPGDLLGELKKTCDLSMMTPEDLAVIRRNRVDYLGLNYYARVMVKPYESGETTLIVNHLCSVELLIPYSLHICVLLFPDSYKLTMLCLNSSVYLVFSMPFSPFLLLYHLSLFAVHFFSIAPFACVFTLLRYCLIADFPFASSPCKRLLYSIVCITVYYRLMMVCYQIHRPFSVVFLDLFADTVHSECFL